MSSPIIELIKRPIRKAIRAPYFQRFWESLFDKALVGMNYWDAGKFRISGELPLVKKLFRDQENVVFFDVGANDGEYAKAIAEILPTSSKLYCFEPFSKMFALMCETTEEIGNIQRHHFGFGAEEDILTIYYDDGIEELTSLYNNIPDRGLSHTENVPIKTVDDFLRSEGIEKIDYLKIDVEGHELKVLEGAKEALKGGRIDHIQFEFGESMVDSRVFFRDFWELLHEDYAIFRILPDGLREICEYTRNLEVFHCVNFLAIRRTKNTAGA